MLAERSHWGRAAIVVAFISAVKKRTASKSELSPSILAVSSSLQTCAESSSNAPGRKLGEAHWGAVCSGGFGRFLAALWFNCTMHTHPMKACTRTRTKAITAQPDYRPARQVWASAGRGGLPAPATSLSTLTLFRLDPLNIQVHSLRQLFVITLSTPGPLASFCL